MCSLQHLTGGFLSFHSRKKWSRLCIKHTLEHVHPLRGGTDVLRNLLSCLKSKFNLFDFLAAEERMCFIPDSPSTGNMIP